MASMRFTLRQLQVFVTIAEYENVSRAAESLAMSQSACSGALKELELAYSTPLFDRVGKGLKLNDVGRRLRTDALALLDQAQALESRLLQHKESALLHIGATLTIGNYLAVDMIRQYRQQTGSLAKLTVDNTQHIIEALLNFELDVALIEGEVNHADLHVIPWQQDQLVCICHPEHPLATVRNATDVRNASDADLIAAAWIVREPGSGTRQAFDRAMHGLLPEFNIVLELQHTEAIKQAVKANLGVACLSEVAVKEEIEQGLLSRVAIPKRDFSRHFYVVLHRQKYRSYGIEHWLKTCGVELLAHKD